MNRIGNELARMKAAEPGMSLSLDNEAVLYRRGKVFYRDKEGFEKLLVGDAAEAALNIFREFQPWLLFEAKADEIANKHLDR